MSVLLVLAAVFLSYAAYSCFLYPAFLSPLAKIPNAHFSTPFSSLWILWIRYRRRENRTLLACHERLGPIIRLGPKELSVNCVDGGIRTIYSGGYEKHNWYTNIFDNYGVPNLFSMAHGKPHSVRKRMISNVYSKSNLQSLPDMEAISKVLLYSRLLPLLEAAADAGTEVDVLDLNYAVAMDFINAYLFGIGVGLNFICDKTSCQRFRHMYQCRTTYTFWIQELPRLKTFLHRCRIRIVPEFVDAANREIEQWCRGMCDRAERLTTDSRLESLCSQPGQTPIVYSQIARSLKNTPTKSNPENTRAAFESAPHPTDLSIASELLDHLAAGHETSGITLTYIMHELSQRPTLQNSLRAELLTLSPPIHYESAIQALSSPDSDMPSARVIDALRLLHAIVMETLRRHAAIPGPQPRVTPSVPTSLAGYDDIPPNTRVSALPYALHRNAVVFPDPNAWKPERWLEAGKEQREEMMRWFWVFGSGGRTCVGSHFAVQEIKLVIAAIYTNYRTRVIDDEGIEQDDGYAAGPVGNKLILGFEKVERTQGGIGSM